MQWFTQLFTGHGAAQTMVALCLAVVLGLALGQVRIWGVRIGVGGVLFSGLLLAHFGLRVEPEILHFVREFGLILFVFTVGMQVGPGIIDSLRRRGLFLNLAALAVVVLGVGIAAGCFFLFDLPLPVAIGLLCGAVTNTPSLAAASDVFREIGGEGSGAAVADMGIGYAIAYPFGIVGIILTMLLVRAVFKVDPEAELREVARREAEQNPPLQSRTLVVSNPNLFGMALRDFRAYSPAGVNISRTKSPNEDVVRAASSATVLTEGMQIHAVGNQENLDKLRTLIGPPAPAQLPDEHSPLEIRRLLVTKSGMAGKSIQSMGLIPEHGVTVTRIIRAGVEFAPRNSVRLHYGDRLVSVGERTSLDRAEKMLGNSLRELDHPHLLPIFLGILLGVVLGSIPIPVPGLPSGLKLGLAGGPLLAAILLSRLNHFAGMVWFLPLGGNLILREVGIALFLACVGLNAGGGFVETLTSGSGLIWVAAGACITFIPLAIVALAVRTYLKYDYGSICGLLAGSMTDPPALAFSVQSLNSDVPASTYATVYPLTMLLRILTAQVLVYVLHYLAG